VALADDDTVQTVEGFALVEIFRARDTEPLLILEDTDTWIARPHDTLPAQLAEAFFARNVRMLATELDCGFVVAVHRNYLELSAYQAVAGRLEPITVPVLPRPEDDLKRIVRQRLEVARLDFDVEQIFEPAALTVLARLYDDIPDVRRAIATAATAVRLSLEEAELERVSAAAVGAAAAERADHSGSS
jgi:Cdc6-like AAA superfamily ATPase